MTKLRYCERVHTHFPVMFAGDTYVGEGIVLIAFFLLHIYTFNWVQYGMSHSGLASSSLTYRIVALVSATVLLAALTELNYRFIEKRFHRTIR